MVAHEAHRIIRIYRIQPESTGHFAGYHLTAASTKLRPFAKADVAYRFGSTTSEHSVPSHHPLTVSTSHWRVVGERLLSALQRQSGEAIH